jgi:hypothetical protein
MLPFTYSPPDAYMPLIHAGDLQLRHAEHKTRREREKGGEDKGVCVWGGEMEDAVTLSRGVSGT